VVVGRNLQLVGRAPLHGHLHAALALVCVPDAVVEAELNLLLDVAGEVVRRHPARVDVEGRLPAVGVGVHHPELDRVPGGPVRRAASKWRSSGVATHTASTPWARSCPTASGPLQLTKGPTRPAALPR